MFILDSLMISGLRWVMNTVVTAADAEMNDDTALREQLLDAEMRREMGEISDEAFVELEADLLARIREIKARREGGAGPLAFGGAEPIDTTGEGRFQIEADVSGDFHEPAEAPHTKVIETEPGHIEEVGVLDLNAGEASTPRTRRRPRTTRRKTRRARPAKIRS